MCSFFSLPWEDVIFTLILPRLEIADCFSLRNVSIESRRLVDSYFQCMRVLNLSKYADIFNINHFLVLSKICVGLRRVILARCSWLTDELLCPLLSQNNAVNYLVLSNCVNLTTACLQSVILNCKDLKTLKLEGCLWLTVGCLDAITLHQFALEDIDLANAHLKSINSTHCFFSKFPNLKNINLEKNPIMDITLIIIGQVCKQLENINIRYCPQITDFSVQLLLESCPKLKCILLRGSTKISRELCQAISTKIFTDVRFR